jgi:hypothetical protein
LNSTVGIVISYGLTNGLTVDVVGVVGVIVGILSIGFSSWSLFIAGPIHFSYRGSALNVISCGKGNEVRA